jgi:GTP-binding protein
VPNLGVVRRPSGDGTVFADIPGLIEGASHGAGLGHDFLRHIERTRLLVHLLDAAAEDVLEDLAVVERELLAYGHGLSERTRLVVLNKIDILDSEQQRELAARIKARVGMAPLLISAATSLGLEALKLKVWEALPPPEEPVEAPTEMARIAGGIPAIWANQGVSAEGATQSS